jgi:hypothetical protein
MSNQQRETGGSDGLPDRGEESIRGAAGLIVRGLAACDAPAMHVTVEKTAIPNFSTRNSLISPETAKNKFGKFGKNLEGESGAH